MRGGEEEKERGGNEGEWVSERENEREPTHRDSWREREGYGIQGDIEEGRKGGRERDTSEDRPLVLKVPRPLKSRNGLSSNLCTLT